MNKKRLVAALCIAVMLISAMPAAALSNENTCEINWYDERQHIDGFGGSIGGNRGAVGILFRSDIIKKLFDPIEGIGVSILRTTVPDSSNKTGFDPVSVEPEKGEWYWDGDTKQIEIMQYAQQFGARIMATPWSAPYWMKSNKNIVGGTLSADYYDEYAKYLSEYVKGYKERYGITISDISVQNEPDIVTGYSSSQFSNDQFYDFLKNHMIPYFEKNNIDANIMIAEDSNWRFTLAEKSMEDKEVADSIGVVAGHAYNGWARYDKAKELLKPIWMTEFCDNASNDLTNRGIEHGLYNAEVIHTFMTVPEVNAFVFWYLAVPDYATTEGLISVRQGFNEVSYNKRFYTFGNYCKFVRPDYVRVGCTESPDSDMFITTYKSPGNDKLVAVVINDSTQTNRTTFNFNGFTAESAEIYRTSAIEDLEYVGILASDGLSATTEFAPKSVTTFVFDVKEQKQQSGRLQAETDASKIGNAQVRANASFSGGAGVGEIGARNNGIEFKNLKGCDKFTVCYTSPVAADMDVYVNDAYVKTITLPSAPSISSEQFDAEIPAGGSLKLLTKNNIASPLIDFIELN